MMNKAILVIITCISLIYKSFATDQVPDILFYEGNNLKVSIGWGHPSPLETYYNQSGIAYPFRMLSTANYRGHVAVWKIENENLYIKEIQIKDEKYSPLKFNVKSKTDSLSNKNKIYADWFTGVLECQLRNKKNYWKTELSFYFYVRKGKIINSQKITPNDFDKLNNLKEKDTSDVSLMEKYSILFLNQNYISYYFRLHDTEYVTFNNKKGRLKGNKNLSPILSYYSNDHLKWPYNWENFESFGAPNGNWLLDGDKLFLLSVNIHYGLDFEKAMKEKIPLETLFHNKVENKRVFADWVTGVYLIEYGKEEIVDEFVPDYKRFKASEFTFLRILNGKIIETRTVQDDFDYKNISENNDSVLKKLIKDFKQN